MLLRPQLFDLKIIGYYLGKVIVGLALAMALPLAVGLIYGEFNPALDFTIAILFALSIGCTLIAACRTQHEPNWVHGMVIVSLSWLIAMWLGAVPLYLSAHWNTYLDACFEAMSGFATTGLTLVQDLDHLSHAHNLWRHFTMFMGGQGIVIVVLSFLVRGTAGAFRIYVGEAREEKILPNVIASARFIWLVSFTYLVVGTCALAVVGVLNGMRVSEAFFHGACIFMAAFDTGGFAPQSQNILYYHSFPFEIVTVFLMLLGAINFKLHYAVWTGNRREIARNIETVTLFFTLIATFLIVAFGLKLNHTYPHALAMFRKGFYHLVSGHSGTGYMTIYARQLLNEWGNLAMTGNIIAMAIGGSACSTTGAIKTIRIGLIFKGMIQDIKRIIMPEAAVLMTGFHHINDYLLEDKHVRSAAIITLAYVGLYIFGTIVGMMCGYPLLDSLFESTSAAANVGLSCGITQTAMPAILKVTYIFQMWAGRLEFMSVFTLLGFLLLFIRGRS